MQHFHRTLPKCSPPLSDLLTEAYAQDPLNEPISPIGEHGYTTLSRVIPSALAVLRVAARIETDPEQALYWYRHIRIAELGFLSAEQLVAMGRTPVVIDFLQSICRGERG